MEKAPPKPLKVAGISPKLGLKIFFADDRGQLTGTPGPGAGTGRTLTVMLVESSDAMRQNLKALLEREPDLEVVAEAGTGAAAIRLARERSPQVAVIDAALPDFNSLEITSRLLAAAPQVKIVILSLYADRRLVANLLRLGAWGYLLKDWAFEELGGGLRTVAAQKVYLGREVLPLALQDYVDRLRNGDGRARPGEPVPESQPQPLAAPRPASPEAGSPREGITPMPAARSGRSPFQDLHQRLSKHLALVQNKLG
jgi:DNA-binding NarL/FixJ family response regulator